MNYLLSCVFSKGKTIRKSNITSSDVLSQEESYLMLLRMKAVLLILLLFIWTGSLIHTAVDCTRDDRKLAVTFF